MQTANKLGLGVAGLLVSSILVVGPVAAQERGTVLKIDGAQAYVDVGTDAGVARGSKLTLFHVISVKHPVSGEQVSDSFPLTTLKVVNASKTISVAVVPEAFQKRIKVGDRISLASEPAVYVDSWTQPTQEKPVDPYSAAPGASSSGHGSAPTMAMRIKAIAKAKQRLALVATIEQAWAATLGKSPEERLEVWQVYLKKHPETPYRRVVDKAMGELHAYIRSTAEPANGERENARITALSRLVRFDPSAQLIHQRPSRIDEGVALTLAFLSSRPGTITTAWLYYRNVGGDAYLRRELTRNGNDYWVGEVPADSVRPPGVEYFVETLTDVEDAEPVRVVANERDPVRVIVNKATGPLPTDKRGRSRVRVVLDYVDFDGFGSGKKFDQYWVGEIDFMYRFRLKGLYSMRLGFGTMNGTGGPKDVIDDDPTNSCMEDGEFRCRDVSYNYAYTELEWHYGDNVGVMLRPQWGSANRDRTFLGREEREFFDAFGLRGRLRFGREDGSNLVIGVAATEQLGTLFEGAFTWDVLKEVPLVFSVNVTDQPVIEDFGVRLIADIGLRKFAWMYPSLRIAYQARDIDHAGLSAGMAVNFDW